MHESLSIIFLSFIHSNQPIIVVTGKVQESDPALDSLCQLARNLQRLVKVGAGGCRCIWNEDMCDLLKCGLVIRGCFIFLFDLMFTFSMYFDE